MKLKLIAFIIGAAGLGLAAGNLYKNSQKPQIFPQIAQQIAPKLNDFSRPVLSGEIKKLSDWKGKIIVLNFWATWCPPCRKEIPTFIKLQNEWQDKNVQFIGISLDDQDEVAAFAEKFNLNYPNMIGSNNDIALSSPMGNPTSALPFSVIINSDFTIIASHAGMMTETMLKHVILPLIKN